MLTRYRLFSTILFIGLLFAPGQTNAQGTNDFDEGLYDGLEFRGIGPYRGGRSAAVTGVTSQPSTFYFGATGGGVWKTDDAGQTWRNISDGFFGGSIGAVAVSEWDPNVIYVGGGEKTVRGNVSHGYGMFRSTDAGATWESIGLADTRHIARVRIHPRNPDLVYAAAMGHLFGPNEQRGVFRSRDGGDTWENILYVNDEVGAVDLVMDPSNPRILYASTWRIKRTPYSLESGGEGSGLWKSTDSGDTWTEITRNDGLPEGTVGIIGVAVSPVDPQRVWAIIEAEDGGVFRSADGGETWRRINDDRNLRQRAWYYTRIYAHPTDRDGVFVLNVAFWRSKDGGANYDRIRTPHGDHHDLWINPDNPNIMVVGDDGGAQVSLNGGDTFSTYHNQPTAQFYRVTTDNHFPYRIYGAQQDNSTVRILHRSRGGSITESDWESTAGGESGHIAPHPDNPDIVYGGSYGGSLSRVDHQTGERRSINVWPDNPMGHGAKDLRYRFQWNYPIFFSPHDTNVLYTAGNVLFKTTNEGQSWEAISPDLTRNDTTTMGPSGGPITKDNTSVEYFGTIFSAIESPHEAGVLWSGSDDGLIHVSRDGGASWDNVTPSRRIMPEWMQINSIEAHPTEPGGLYVAGTRYKSDDFSPYLYKTVDYGANWEKITDGIPDDHFTRVIRADPDRAGLLFAGTESGLYFSLDDGAEWRSFQLNLPIVPITDLAIKEQDLIVATQGRSFWVLDDMSPLHQLSDEVASSGMWLFNPRPAYRMSGSQSGPSLTAGQNAPGGVLLRYYLADASDSTAATIRILEADGTVIESYAGDDDVTVDNGLNEWTWNMRYPSAERFDGMVIWGGGTQGPRAMPGSYQARLIIGSDSVTVPFEILKDPRTEGSVADIAAQFAFLIEVRDKLTETHNAIEQIREVRGAVKEISERDEAQEREDLQELADGIVQGLTDVEKELYQTRNRSGQDPLNYPIKLNNRLSGVVGGASSSDFRPTDQAYQVRDEVTRMINVQLEALREILETDIPRFNQMVRELEIPAVATDPDRES